MWRKIRLLLIISCLIAAVNANAQFDDPKTIEVGPHVGVSYYMGDINPAKPFAMSDLQYGGVVRFNYNNRWTFRFDYSHAIVKADDAVIKWRPERGISFTTSINDFSLMAEFNFLEYYTGNPKKNVSPYIFGGISLFQYNPYQRIYDADLKIDTLVYLRDYKVDTIYRELKPKNPQNPNASDELTMFSNLAEFFGGRTNKIGVSIPFGVGVKFSLSKHMAATVEWRMQKTLTDYLDGVGGVYLEDIESFEIKHIVYNKDGQGNQNVDTQNSYVAIYNLSDPSVTPLHASVDNDGNTIYPKDDDGNPITVPDSHYKAGQQRGNSAFNDWFGMARVSLTWKFNLPDGRGCNLSKF